MVEALEAGPVRALGAMSGTSLDGVDAAVVMTDGDTIAGFGESAYRPYGEEERSVLRAALGGWHGDAGVDAAARVVEDAHAAVLSELGGDVVGFHGQTTAHDPGGRGTCQIGDGARLAGMLGRPVVWDFRSLDVARGGQGAPLAPFYHHACARWIGAEGPVGFLNLGGVGNLTIADPRIAAPEREGALIAFDTGPANAPLDDLMRERRGCAMDAGGRLALEGTPDAGVIARLMAEPFFARPTPKSLDRDAFAWLGEAVSGLGDADAAATLAAAVAASVAAGLERCGLVPERLLVCGGGRRNAAVMAMLRETVRAPVAPAEDAGLDGDMLEAQAFAYLAVRVARGLPTSAPGTTGVPVPVGGGTVSRPSPQDGPGEMRADGPSPDGRPAGRLFGVDSRTGLR